MALKKIISLFFTSVSIILIGIFAIFSAHAQETGKLVKDQKIFSEHLQYEMMYHAYLPPGYDKKAKYPTIYISDGQWYLSEGKMKLLLDRMISEEKITPVIAIFVDSRNPNNLTDNRRNQQFMCNEKYASFFANELIPTIDYNYSNNNDRRDRVILGLSFGGLNSGCFGLMIPSVFHGIAMQSPASDKHLKLLQQLYEQQPKQDIKIFMSFGTKNDNTKAGRRLMKLFKRKGYDLTYKEVKKGHNWKNWKPLLDDVLITYFNSTHHHN